jgi:hypothetical protein
MNRSTQSQNIVGRRMRWRSFFQIVPSSSFGHRAVVNSENRRASGRRRVETQNFASLLGAHPSNHHTGPPRIEDYITHTTKHLDQMRSAAVAYEASNIKPQA